MPHYGKKSLERLSQVHPKLHRIAMLVIKVYDIAIAEGHRAKKEQDEAYGKGTSGVMWPNSKHNIEPSRALDSWIWPVEWPTLKRIPTEYHEEVRNYAKSVGKWYHMGGIFKGVAVALGIKIKWGGDFKSLFDGPHVELDDDEE